MAPKKTDDKAKEITTLSVDIETFKRTRDLVITNLDIVNNAIQALSKVYIQHTNHILGEHGALPDAESSALARLGDNPLLGSLQALARVPTPVPAADSDKKERKKRQHDPNAPKRPLTPFFLYMQTARPIIANDLGPDAAKGAVSSEGTRRWSSMAADDKQLWTNAYKENLRLYNARMHSYKQGHNENAKDMTDQEAVNYADLHNIGADNTADAQLVGEATAGGLLDEDAEGEPEKEPTPPPKATPKAKASRKAKPAKSTPVAVPETIVPPAPIVPAKEPEKEKPAEKKRKRASKKADEVVEPEEPAVAETPKSTAKPRKKKAKADA